MTSSKPFITEVFPKIRVWIMVWGIAIPWSACYTAWGIEFEYSQYKWNSEMAQHIINPNCCTLGDEIARVPLACQSSSLKELQVQGKIFFSFIWWPLIVEDTQRWTQASTCTHENIHICTHTHNLHAKRTRFVTSL